MKKRVLDHFTSANFHVIFWTTNRPDGFLHHAVIYPNGPESAFDPVEGRARWYNRTWESFRYESATARAIAKLPARYREQARAELITARNAATAAEADRTVAAFKKAYESMPAGCQRAAQGIAVGSVEDAQRLTGIFSAIGLLCNASNGGKP